MTTKKRIHDGWLRTTKPPAKAYAPDKPKPDRHGIEPRLCNACKRGFVPVNADQMYCTTPNCVRDRDAKRQQERQRLHQMMEDADAKKQKHDGIGKAQMAEVKRVFRERKGILG